MILGDHFFLRSMAVMYVCSGDLCGSKLRNPLLFTRIRPNTWTPRKKIQAAALNLYAAQNEDNSGLTVHEANRIDQHEDQVDETINPVPHTSPRNHPEQDEGSAYPSNS